METINIKDQINNLLKDRYGTLTKVSVDKYSEVPVGYSETGLLEVIEHEEGPMVFIFNGFSSMLKTSPIQSIELVEPMENANRVLFKTRTSVYEAVVNDFKSQPIDDNDDLTLG